MRLPVPRVPGPVRGTVLAMLLALLPAMAIAGPSSYTGTAPVNSQSDEERTGALQTALANVVIEQTGDSGVIARPELAKAIEKAERYVLQYSYRRNSAGDAPMTLVAQFDAGAVDQMLQKFGLGALAAVPVAPETPTEATVWIGGIRDADDYARVIGYLGHNNFVKALQPTQATSDGILVHLSLSTDVAHFLGAVAMERTLAEGTSHVDGADAALVLGH
ncbi:MAG: DUF2066 domain-containing protein [Dokdonella sp.]|uniref:DUF2066 domain-containing protein n=1 Tax=Dokdonella sp. TaxID=2291710 RepID=UPI003F81B607